MTLGLFVRSLAAASFGFLCALPAPHQSSPPAQAQAPRTKILYLEGEPRAEMKFINRAMADRGPAIACVQRTFDGKYLRLGVEGPYDLADGFPKTREELFRYAGVILGSIEADAYTADQHRMLADFVTERGGGLLALGGSRAFGDGGWDGTPLAALLPVDVWPKHQAKKTPVTRLDVVLTAAGLDHPATRLLGQPAAAPVWRTLPAVTSVNDVYTLKPGATALLTALDAGGREAVVLAVGREGRGRTAAFTAQDSWTWQLHPKAPPKVHEEFWQALLGWLVAETPKS